MKLLVGLGNPGQKYSHNRHNVGFMFSEFFAEKIVKDFSLNLNADNIFEQNNKFRAFICELKTPQEKYIIAKPQTYMNLSGESVNGIAKFYKIPPNDIFVAHDDLDILLGKFKVQLGSGPKVHNGLSSIEQHLGTKDFWRIRIGIENRNPEHKISGESYVLGDFSEEEKQIIKNTSEQITQRLLDLMVR